MTFKGLGILFAYWVEQLNRVGHARKSEKFANSTLQTDRAVCILRSRSDKWQVNAN